MILKQFKRMLLIVSIAASVLSGCWSINPIIHPTRLLDAGTTVEIIDVTKDVLFNSVVTSDQKTIDTMIKRIIELTRDELVTMDIDAYRLLVVSSGLRYDGPSSLCPEVM